MTEVWGNHHTIFQYIRACPHGQPADPGAGDQKKASMTYWQSCQDNKQKKKLLSKRESQILMWKIRKEHKYWQIKTKIKAT